MATTSLQYATHTQFKELVPYVSSAGDNKIPIYNWVVVSGSKYAAHNSGLVTQLFANGEDLGPQQSAHTDLNVEGEWFYNSAEDVLYYYSATSPADKLMESGSEWTDLIDQQLENATMELNSMLDARFPIPIPQTFQHGADVSNDTPEYDFLIIKATCYIAGANMLRASNPEDERATALYDMITNLDGTGIIDKINKAEIKLRFEIDKGDASGEIIESVRTGTMYLVETYCESWSGALYDKIEIVCGSGDGGVYGTAKIDVKTLDGDNLSGNTISDIIVTGGLQHLTGGLYVRFEGNSMTAGDKWFLPVRSKGLQSTNSAIKTINVRT